jgi:hypothetical protein
MHSWNPEAIEGDFAAASIDPSLWPKALDRVTAMTNSYGALLLPVTGRVLPTVPFTEAMAGSFETYIRDGWNLRDERQRGISIMRQRGVVDDLDLSSAQTIARHPYYQEFLAPHRLRWFAGVGVFCGGEVWCLSIQRTMDQDPFSETQKNRLAQLSKRLSGAAAIARALGASTAAGALEAFEISGTAVALINRHGKIFEANESARRLLMGEIKIEKGRLVATSHEATTAFDRAVHGLLSRPGGGLSPPIALARKGRRPLLAYPTKLSRLMGNSLADCQAMVIFIDPDTGPRPAEASLRSVFRLTDAEVRLAVQLATGVA